MIKIWECILWCLATGHPEILSLRHFSFSAPSVHRCALCLPIDLITKVDFNWIAGKAHKKRTEVIKKKNLGGRREDDRRGEKEGLRDGRDRLQVTRSSLGPHFKQKLICPERKVSSASIISKQLNKESAGFSSPVNISYQPERTLLKWLPQQRRACPAASWWELLVFTAAVFLLAWSGRSQSCKTGNSAR